jgi:hypothetical protein
MVIHNADEACRAARTRTSTQQQPAITANGFDDRAKMAVELH